MMKRLLIISSLLLLFSACSEGNEGKIQETDKEDEQVEENVQEEEGSDEEADEAEEGKPDNPDDKGETAVEDNDKQTGQKEPENEVNDKENAKDLAHNIVFAQADKDYSYLKSVAGKGVTINEGNATIEFNTEDASHTFDIIEGITEEDLEFRFIDEDKTDRAIVGFGVIDYENESSYVLEMILRTEEGKWKLTSLDINK